MRVQACLPLQQIRVPGGAGAIQHGYVLLEAVLIGTGVSAVISQFPVLQVILPHAA